LSSIIESEESTVVKSTEPSIIEAGGSSEVVSTTAGHIEAIPSTSYIVRNDITTITRNDEPDPWFKSMLENNINTSNLANEVSDLANQFNNFEDGTTLQIGYLQTEDTKLAYDIAVTKVANDTATAAISQLRISKIGPDGAATIARNTLAAWQNNGSGGAWFDSQVSAISNAAYSAAKSASTLTATMNSQQDNLNALNTDIATLKAQVDGEVSTWLGTWTVVLPDGSIDDTKEPYATWVINNTVAVHTGDTYVQVDDLDSTIMVASWTFVKDGETEEFQWLSRTDDTANEALQKALEAGILADGKATTYYQTYPPQSNEVADLGCGDIWIDSDDNNKLYRYQPVDKSACRYALEDTEMSWQYIDDKRIQASVDRIDEATVNVIRLNPDWIDDGCTNVTCQDINPEWINDGSDTDPDSHGQSKYIYGTTPDVNGVDKFITEAYAKGSLKVHANGTVAGYTAEANGETSSFKIFADRFSIANNEGSSAGEPFIVEGGEIRFNGVVSFEGTPAASALQPGGAAADINTNVTTINGDKVRAGIIAANVGGNYINLNSGATKINTPGNDFILDSAAAGTSSSPNIQGAYIKGGHIDGTTISFRDLRVTTDGDYLTSSTFIRSAHSTGSMQNICYYNTCWDTFIRDPDIWFDIYSHNDPGPTGDTLGRLASAGTTPCIFSGQVVASFQYDDGNDYYSKTISIPGYIIASSAVSSTFTGSIGGVSYSISSGQIKTICGVILTVHGYNTRAMGSYYVYFLGVKIDSKLASGFAGKLWFKGSNHSWSDMTIQAINI